MAPAKYGLKGAIATMDAGKVLANGVVYVDASTGLIAAVQEAAAPPPPDFTLAPIIATTGTIFPGLIELHNHLCYNILTLWKVPKQWEHRDQWPNHPDYLKLVRGPAQTLGNTHGATYLAPLIRYVEAKCLMGGVTTSQGITLKDVNTRKHFQGNVRNVENSQPPLKHAGARIGDPKKGQAAALLAEMNTVPCYLLHLSEGQRDNSHAIERFDWLELSDGSGWAITPALAGIHSAALRPADLQILADHGAAMVWSPFSNLLLYGTTADVATAGEKGIRIGLGSDWSPTGSKNLLGEMKVARLFSQNNGNLFSDEEIVTMATATAANILQWHNQLGKIKAGMIADLVVVQRTGANVYSRLVEATEADIALVTIGGVARYGRKAIMRKLSDSLEPWKVKTKSQAFHFDALDPEIIVTVSLKEAANTLRDGMRKLPQLAVQPPAGPLIGLAGSGAGAVATGWTLDIDDDVDSAFFASGAAQVPFKDVAIPLDLDPLTAVEDSRFLSGVKNQLAHVPAWLRDGLPAFYGGV